MYGLGNVIIEERALCNLEIGMVRGLREVDSQLFLSEVDPAYELSSKWKQS